MPVLWNEGDTLPMLGGRISEIMREAGVPSVLWDSAYLNLLGMKNLNNCIAFVVEDEDMNAAIRAIRKVGFLERAIHYSCTDCYGYVLPEDPQQIETVWFLRDANYCFRANPHPIVRSDYPSDKAFVAALGELDKRHGFGVLDYPHIGLYLKSQLMWTVPKFSLDDPPENDEHFMRASDIRLPGARPLGDTRYSPAYGQVVVLTPAAFVKVLILSVVRCAQLTGEVQPGEGYDDLHMLLLQPDTVGNHFSGDFLDIENYDRFPEGIRGIWRLVNALEPENWAYRDEGRRFADGEKAAFDRLVLQVGKRMADEGNLPALLDSWIFKPT